ncbi:MAG TPA: cbb3-type cytochrome c oxidase subunit I [Saprospiraceae bacterium]|nr:cbb3-type cytochrome c oxidase subunit I [Saprospiraceae bacterium]MCC6688220.1 cbb3-type cytochrome c oxidase subunit I [Saprospiraceae bacterium]HMV23300.1 cbb3-type cytochrome c oxidase subunit I [Saprospiraceae bacterium]HMX86180.1 cbb3-type cytochrome c oxidase subunit I [Saprospiraceae bacterium]HMZ73695.1 cbb3-type cytochrome c oxidase subunit I [Saprospiraceae bacterium]
MNTKQEPKTGATKNIAYLMNPKNWWGPLLFILIISLAGVGMIGYQTYVDAPPMSGFKDDAGKIIIDKQTIIRGQEVFHKYALMEYGSFFGDGAQRGPDFTAEALHYTGVFMSDYYINQFKQTKGIDPTVGDIKQINEQVKTELKKNNYDKADDIVKLTPSQVFAIDKLKTFYQKKFSNEEKANGLLPSKYISSEAEINDLAAFFFWGGWVCVTERPGSTFSYTHNWPFDPSAGNTPTSPVILWSVLGLLGFVLACGIVLYFIGQYNQLSNKFFKPATRDLFNTARVAAFNPTPSQKATYKFFAVAILLFFLQVSSGLITLNDFINWLGVIGIHVKDNMPVTISRSWHLMLSLYWISICWIASSIFILPILSKKEIRGQVKLINTIFIMLLVLAGGSLTGMILGPLGLLGEWWNLLGHQGWEFVDFGKLYQVLLMAIFAVWMVVVYRGLKPAFIKGQPWNLPNWIMYSVVGIPVLFISGFVATPETNFVIADFWRWMVIHMWVEAFFEVFITVIVSYLMVLMGLVSRQAAIRVVYFATIMFLGTGLLGISHNFYWNAKPVATMALGSVFSTLQFVPLILLTVEAWRFKNTPKIAVGDVDHKNIGDFGFPTVFKFLVAVNFWNFFGAGVLGIIINLPIMNYFEHGTYLTVNHAHAALMGVYGNISLAALIFASRLMIKNKNWNDKMVNISFWSINIGLMLMVLLDLFPAGSIQFKAVVEQGLWFGRSSEFVDSGAFHQLTWMRGVGATLFFFGGVLPITWFIVSRARYLKSSTNTIEGMDAGIANSTESGVLEKVD